MKFKLIFILLFLLLCNTNKIYAQYRRHTKNIVLILIDGVRWHEIFDGANYRLLTSKRFTSQDSSKLMKKYWSNSLDKRRKKLMPFVWNYIAKHGQLYGDRKVGNKVNVKNPYWISYPGRAEVLSGFVDPKINSNDYGLNPNTNVLAFINHQKSYKHKVVTFACWDATRRDINPKKNGTLVNAPWHDIQGKHLTSAEKLANQMQHYTVRLFGNVERLDPDVYALAKSYIQAHHPKVMYLDFGDTDEYAHEGRYDYYLDDLHNLDKVIKNLWEYMQHDKFYKNKTTFFIVPDHGRGIDKDWTSHGSSIPHSNETWFMAVGPNIKPLGVVKKKEQIYQTQYAKTIAKILGFQYTVPGHKVGKTIKSVFR
jgi:hypothetical protein